MVTKGQLKKVYVTPAICNIANVELEAVLAGSGITTPGEDQGEDGGGLSKRNQDFFWDEYDGASESDNGSDCPWDN